jgi:hypothetical protein
VQSFGFWPLNLMQRRFVRGRIAASETRAAAAPLPAAC